MTLASVHMLNSRRVRHHLQRHVGFAVAGSFERGGCCATCRSIARSIVGARSDFIHITTTTHHMDATRAVALDVDVQRGATLD